MRPVVILFAKAPLPGRVKTRLHSKLTPEQAAELHYCFTRDTLELLETLQDVADVELFSDTSSDAWRTLGVTIRLQTTGDLGQRMFHALEAALAAGRPRAMIIGSDSPTLPAGYLHQLLAATADVALGPSEDGGFYAISCRKIHPEMFRDVVWSTVDTLTQAIRAVKSCGLTVMTGQSWIDIDDSADLERLKQAAKLPRHTARWFSTHFR